MNNGIPYPILSKISEIENVSTIPRKIHLSWKSENLSTYPISSSLERWKSFGSKNNYTIYFWTDDDLMALLKQNYSHIINIYKGYPYDIQRADVGKLLILYHEGGIFSDLDVFPNQDANVLLEILAGFSAIFPLAEEGGGVTNSFMMAEKSAPVLKFMLDNLRTSFAFFRFLTVFYTTGPYFVTEMTSKFYLENPDSKIAAINPPSLKYICHHKAGRSWISWEIQMYYYFTESLSYEDYVTGFNYFIKSISILVLLILYILFRKRSK